MEWTAHERDDDSVEVVRWRGLVHAKVSCGYLEQANC